MNFNFPRKFLFCRGESSPYTVLEYEYMYLNGVKHCRGEERCKFLLIMTVLELRVCVDAKQGYLSQKELNA